jgi:hypothetical protein
LGNAQIPFALTQQTVITLAKRTFLNDPRDQFTGATNVTAVPEPASASFITIAAAAALLARSRSQLESRIARSRAKTA